MRIGIICEGSTDDVVLRAVLRGLCGQREIVFSALQPPADKLSGHISLGGWQAVRAFLQKSAATIGAAPLDMIVVQVDADIRNLHEIKAQLPSPETEKGQGELDALCQHVKSWMTAGVPESVVIVLPRENTETWLVAANTNRRNVEAIEDPVRALVDAGCLAAAKGKGAKVPANYGELVKPLVPKLAKPKELQAIPELERFIGKVRARIRRVTAKVKLAKGGRS